MPRPQFAISSNPQFSLFDRQWRSAILLLLGIMWSCNAQTADLRSNISAWKKAFDTVPADQAYVQRTVNIFERLKSVVGSKVLFSELYILDSDNEPWAIALEDGNVVLSRGALDIVYGDNNASLRSKDARMAFVLGHELSHIDNKDFWHEQVYRGFVSRNQNTDSVQADPAQTDPAQTDPAQTDRRQSRRRESELRADEDGFIYASLSGFNTRDLFASIDNKTDFLHYWVHQTGTAQSSGNFTAQERVDFLANTMHSLDVSIEFFNHGTRLAHFGDYENARILLDEFYKAYPSREVLANLGYVYLQLARGNMPAYQVFQYWYPALLELDSGLPPLTRTVQVPIPATAKRQLLKAEKILEEAVRLAPGDLVASKNLATTYLYLENYIDANSVLEIAIEKSPTDYQLHFLRIRAALGDSLSGNHWESDSARRLIELGENSRAPLDLLYNMARFMDVGGHTASAKAYWSRVIDRKSELPLVYQDMLCLQFADRPECMPGQTKYSVRPEPWAPPVAIGVAPGDSVDDRQIKNVLAQWGDPLQEYLGDIDAEVYRHDNGNSLLAVDGIVKLVVIKQHPFDFKQHLVEKSTEHGLDALLQYTRGTSTILSSGRAWAALVRGEQVSELWYAGP